MARKIEYLREAGDNKKKAHEAMAWVIDRLITKAFGKDVKVQSHITSVPKGPRSEFDVIFSVVGKLDMSNIDAAKKFEKAANGKAPKKDGKDLVVSGVYKGYDYRAEFKNLSYKGRENPVASVDVWVKFNKK